MAIILYSLSSPLVEFDDVFLFLVSLWWISLHLAYGLWTFLVGKNPFERFILGSSLID